REAAQEAEAIIELQTARFVETLQASTRQAPLRRLRAHGERSRADALAKAKQQLAGGESPEAVLDFLAHTLTNKLLHAPTVALREAALTGDADLARAAEKLFPAADGGDDTQTPEADR
ncbi:MAG TPA: glutamyl-tRNA reductase, partial [Lysobacter sp.]|nr:glutamyl-tRNA reductase [Lysobacter sp.]